eukprot:g2292.t1
MNFHGEALQWAIARVSEDVRFLEEEFGEAQKANEVLNSAVEQVYEEGDEYERKIEELRQSMERMKSLKTPPKVIGSTSPRRTKEKEVTEVQNKTKKHLHEINKLLTKLQDREVVLKKSLAVAKSICQAKEGYYESENEEFRKPTEGSIPEKEVYYESENEEFRKPTEGSISEK